MRYGEIMAPLEVNKIRARLPESVQSDPELEQLIRLLDSTQRAEIVSHYTSWSREETEAYRSGNWVEFSRLRGYSQSEIGEFRQSLELLRTFEQRYGEDDASSIIYEHQRHAGLIGLDPRDVLESPKGVKMRPR